MAKQVGGWVCMPKAEHNKLKNNKCSSVVAGISGRRKKRKAKKR